MFCRRDSTGLAGFDSPADGRCSRGPLRPCREEAPTLPSTVSSRAVLIRFEGRSITPLLEQFLYRKLKVAEDAGADVVIIEIDSPGGMVDDQLRHRPSAAGSGLGADRGLRAARGAERGGDRGLGLRPDHHGIPTPCWGTPARSCRARTRCSAMRPRRSAPTSSRKIRDLADGQTPSAGAGRSDGRHEPGRLRGDEPPDRREDLHVRRTTSRSSGDTGVVGEGSAGAGIAGRAISWRSTASGRWS